MKLIYENEQKSRQVTIRYIYYVIIALLLSALHILFINLISVGGITPDLLLILIIWITISEGRFVALFAGFIIGIMFDLITADIVGLNALVKTIAAFVAGWFYKEGKEDITLGSLTFPGIVFLSSIIHNLIYYFFYIKLSEISFLTFFLKYGLAISFYTTVFSLFPMFLRISRRKYL